MIQLVVDKDGNSKYVDIPDSDIPEVPAEPDIQARVAELEEALDLLLSGVTE